MLRVMAAQWVTALWEGTFNCYSILVFEVRKVFDFPVQGQEAAICLWAFWQGFRSAVSFSVVYNLASITMD